MTYRIQVVKYGFGDCWAYVYKPGSEPRAPRRRRDGTLRPSGWDSCHLAFTKRGALREARCWIERNDEEVKSDWHEVEA